MKKKRAYDDVRNLTEVPLSKREEVKNSRGNKVKPRRYHETEKTAARAKAAFLGMKKLFPNTEAEKLVDDKFYVPYRPTGPYCGSVMALYLLGANKFHELYEVKNMMKTFMSKVGIDSEGRTAWQRFSDKLPRENATRTQDVNGRIIDNMLVLQRLGGHNPCGNKLAEIGCCIDIKKEADGKIYYRLNTHFDIDTMKPLLDKTAYYAARDKENMTEAEKEHSEKVKQIKRTIDKKNRQIIKELLDEKAKQEETTLCEAKA